MKKVVFFLAVALLHYGTAFGAEACLVGKDLAAVSDFQGLYNGTYTGNDYGTWTVKCDSRGNAIGVCWSDRYRIPDAGSGSVNASGVFVAAMEGGAVLTGTIAADMSVQGTWSNPYTGQSGALQGRLNLPSELAVYMGRYSGTYSGTDHGNWEVDVDSSGKGSGTVWSDTLRESYSGYGIINASGEMMAVVSSGSILHGTVDPSYNIAGIWYHPSSGGGTIFGSRISQPLPSAPALSITTSGTTANIYWTAAENATGYYFFYEPSSAGAPCSGSFSGKIDVGNMTGAPVPLYEGACFCVAIQGYNSVGVGDLSNIEYFRIDSGPSPLSVNPSSLSLSVNQTGSCAITGGTAPYSVSSSNTSVAITSVAGSTVFVRGVAQGTATVTISDSGAQTAWISVTVTGDMSRITVNPSSLSLSVDQTGSCAISGGTAPYTSSSSDNRIAVTEVAGSTVFIRGMSGGSTTITVRDSGSDTATVSVSVSGGGSTYTNSLCQTFLLIPAGTFTMGSPSDEPGRYSDEGPQHTVTLTQSFYMQNTEVTQEQWEAVMGNNPSYFSGCPTCPVEEVSWWDVHDFIAKMNERGEGTYRLPTEAEWEYAARAGSTTAFYNGGITETGCDYDPNLDAIGWYCYNSDAKTHPVAQKAPNAWGLYDMSGNVWEWCEDWFSSSYYTSSPSTDPTGPSSGSYRVIRGGSWIDGAQNCRSAGRYNSSPDYTIYSFGFRLVRQP